MGRWASVPTRCPVELAVMLMDSSRRLIQRPALSTMTAWREQFLTGSASHSLPTDFHGFTTTLWTGVPTEKMLTVVLDLVRLMILCVLPNRHHQPRPQPLTVDMLRTAVSLGMAISQTHTTAENIGTATREPEVYDLVFNGCNFQGLTDCGERPVCDECDNNCEAGHTTLQIADISWTARTRKTGGMQMTSTAGST